MPRKTKPRRRQRRRRRARPHPGRHRGGAGLVSQSTQPITNHGARHSTGIGAKIGAGLGNWAEKGIRSLFGSGDYHEEHAKSGLDVEANSIVQPMTAAQVPEFSTPESLHGAVRVAHREYIGDISTGVAGGSDFFRTYQITPLNPQLFPWLSVMAQNFQQWIAWHRDGIRVHVWQCILRHLSCLGGCKHGVRVRSRSTPTHHQSSNA